MTTYLKPTRGRIALLSLTVGAALVLFALWPFQADATPDNHFEGTVMSAGASALMIQTSPDNDTIAFRVEPKAAITRDGEKVSLDKVASGDNVTVESTVKENERIATNIVAHSPY